MIFLYIYKPNLRLNLDVLEHSLAKFDIFLLVEYFFTQNGNILTHNILLDQALSNERCEQQVYAKIA